jgi:hypothetical protein
MAPISSAFFFVPACFTAQTSPLFNNNKVAGRRACNMEDMVMKKSNNTVVNYTIVGRNGKALVLNNNTNKFSVLNDNNTTMACIKMLADLVSRLTQTDDVLNIVFIPRCLGGILRLSAVDEWIANGNKTANGVQLSEDYVELVKYVTDMRKWLGTNNLILKIQGGDLIRPTEKPMIDKAWRQLDKIAGKANKTNTNGASRPVAPNSMATIKPHSMAVKSVAVEDIEL